MRAFNHDEGIAWRPRRLAAALRRLIRKPTLGKVLVAESARGSNLVGYVVSTVSYDLEFCGSDAFVTELFVRPEWRSRGLGERLLDAALKEMGTMGVKALHLCVRPENTAATRLYKRMGFQRVPRVMMTRFPLRRNVSRSARGRRPT